MVSVGSISHVLVVVKVHEVAVVCIGLSHLFFVGQEVDKFALLGELLNLGLFPGGGIKAVWVIWILFAVNVMRIEILEIHLFVVVLIEVEPGISDGFVWHTGVDRTLWFSVADVRASEVGEHFLSFRINYKNTKLDPL